MCSKNKDFSYLHMLWGTRCIEYYIGNVITAKRMNAIIYIISFAFVAIESGNTEVCLYQSRFDISNSYTRVG